jgi:hypothetical protein
MGKIKRRCGKKKNSKSEKVVADQTPNLTQSLPTFVPLSHMSLDAYPTRRKQKSEKQLFLFFFPMFFLILFGNLDFSKMHKMKNQIY